MRPRFFAPEADRSEPVSLPQEEAHHFLHVLRLRAGAEIVVFDGRGHEWDATVVTAEKRRGVIATLTRPVPVVAEPHVQVTLGIGLLKGDQMDAVVRDATALGVSRIIPVLSAHVAVPSRASNAGVGRWERVAIAAAKQCRRAVIPEITQARPFDALMQGHEFALRVMCIEPAVDTATSRLATLPESSAALLLVGPEGGWAQEEIEIARKRDATFLSLGPRTLRAETAPIVALSVLWTTWGWTANGRP